MATIDVLSIGELSKLTGCNIETIRYYERIGLTPKADRRGKYRTYVSADVDRLRFIRRARELGFALDEIRMLLEIAGTDEMACAKAKAIATANLSSVRARLADLLRMEQILTETVRACDARDRVSCPLIEALSERR